MVAKASIPYCDLDQLVDGKHGVLHQGAVGARIA
jgi:hypothetical protein